VRYSKASSGVRMSGRRRFRPGRAAAVQIEISVRGGVIEAFVEALAGILFHVQACDADAFCAAIAGGHVDPAVLGQGLVKLRNLIALGQVGIEVVLAAKMERSRTSQLMASEASVANSTAFSLSTGKAPGSPRHTGQTLVLGPSRIDWRNCRRSWWR